MKRKIRIIIAAIVAISGVATLLAPAGEASAATAWCTLENGEYQEHFAKYCARAIVGDHKDTKITETYQTGYNTNSTQTYTVATWCGSYKTVCKKIIKDHLSYNNNSSTAPTKDYFVDMIYDVIKGGVSKADPCASSKANSGAYESCKKGSWEYYYKDSSQAGGSNTGGGSGGGSGESKKGEEDPAKTGNCTSILPASWCNKENPESLGESGIVKMVKFVISVMTGAVVVAGTIGIIICGVLWMTARDNQTQVATAKRRLLEIVIGMVAWGLIAVLINFFIPQTEAKTNEDLSRSVETVKTEEKIA